MYIGHVSLHCSAVWYWGHGPDRCVRRNSRMWRFWSGIIQCLLTQDTWREVGQCLSTDWRHRMAHTYICQPPTKHSVSYSFIAVQQPMYCVNIQWTSTSVVRTGVYPHMPIAANSLQHWPSLSKRQPVSHTTHSPRLSSQVCHTRLTTVRRVIDFSIFDLGGLPLGQSSPKGEMTW